MDGPFLADTFTLLEDAAAIAAYLVRDDPAARFPFVVQARIGFVLQQPMLTLHGDPCDAYIARATVQGPHRLLWQVLAAQLTDPTERWPVDFFVYVDAAAWARRGFEEEIGPSGFPILREALIYHELCHLRQLVTADGTPRFGDDGRAMLALTRHTYECFQDEIVRYGPTTLGLEQIALDVVDGAAREKVRRRRGQLRSA